MTRNWTLLDNPAWADKLPQQLAHSDCHDGSHFLTIECDSCSGQMHVHESQTREVPRGQAIASACKDCGALLVFPAGTFADAFAEMRRSGWIR